jgi:hypothetical protein
MINTHALSRPGRRMQQAVPLKGTAMASQTAAAVPPIQQLPDVSTHSNSSVAPQFSEQAILQQQKQQETQGQPLHEQQQPQAVPVHGLPVDLVKQIGPVDVVYLWVNGSDPVLAQELQELHDHPPASGTATAGNSSSPNPPQPVDNPARKSRFDAGCDELRYSLRSVERYMPWFRHVYIVTNGQVGRTQPVMRILTSSKQERVCDGMCIDPDAVAA